jgi:hypothetical protein
VTLPKPLEVETGELAGSPPRHDPLDLGRVLRSCVVPAEGAISVAGIDVPLGPNDDPVLVATGLRLTLHDRFLDRHPMADASAWETFLTRARGVVASERVDPEEIPKLLLRVIDGL